MLIDVGGSCAGINKSRMAFDSITEHVGLAKLLIQALGPLCKHVYITLLRGQ